MVVSHYVYCNLPGIGFRRFAAGAGPDLVQLLQGGFVQLDLQGAQGAGQAAPGCAGR